MIALLFPSTVFGMAASPAPDLTLNVPTEDLITAVSVGEFDPEDDFVQNENITLYQLELAAGLTGTECYDWFETCEGANKPCSEAWNGKCPAKCGKCSATSTCTDLTHNKKGLAIPGYCRRMAAKYSCRRQNMIFFCPQTCGLCASGPPSMPSNDAEASYMLTAHDSRVWDDGHGHIYEG